MIYVYKHIIAKKKPKYIYITVVFIYKNKHNTIDSIGFIIGKQRPLRHQRSASPFK